MYVVARSKRCCFVYTPEFFSCCQLSNIYIKVLESCEEQETQYCYSYNIPPHRNSWELRSRTQPHTFTNATDETTVRSDVLFNEHGMCFELLIAFSCNSFPLCISWFSLYANSLTIDGGGNECITAPYMHIWECMRMVLYSKRTHTNKANCYKVSRFEQPNFDLKLAWSKA